MGIVAFTVLPAVVPAPASAEAGPAGMTCARFSTLGVAALSTREPLGDEMNAFDEARVERPRRVAR